MVFQPYWQFQTWKIQVSQLNWLKVKQQKSSFLCSYFVLFFSGRNPHLSEFTFVFSRLKSLDYQHFCTQSNSSFFTSYIYYFYSRKFLKTSISILGNVYQEINQRHLLLVFFYLELHFCLRTWFYNHYNMRYILAKKHFVLLSGATFNDDLQH